MLQISKGEIADTYFFAVLIDAIGYRSFDGWIRVKQIEFEKFDWENCLPGYVGSIGIRSS
jgi:hypothetical protein